MTRTGKSRWLIAGLVAGFVLLALVGAALLGAYLYLSRQSQPEVGWVNPVESVRGEAVAPDLAALTLAGETDERVFRAALDAGEKETAYATLAYSLLMPDNVRGGHWLLLGPYSQEGMPERATVCYQVALDLAALSPALSDSARADLSLQAARGYSRLGESQAARLALAQVENIARYGLELLPAQRRAVLAQLADAYRALGDGAAAASLRREPDAIGPGVAVEPRPLLLPTLRGSVVLPAEVTAAIVARQAAAAELAAGWFSADEDRRAELARQLGDALREEDRVRAGFYATAEDLPTADRLALLHDQVTWLTVKYRVARGDLGTSLVPEWEGQVLEVRKALAEGYTRLINGYGQQVGTLDAADAAQARVELLRQGVLWIRLGLFPDYAEETLSEQLADAAQQLWTRQGNAGLTIVLQDVGGRRFYLLSGAGGLQPQATSRRPVVRES